MAVDTSAEGYLVRGALRGLLVGSPPHERRGVPEAVLLHLVVGNLADELRRQRNPADVACAGPARRAAGRAPSDEACSALELVQLLQQRPAFGGLERRRVSDVMQRPVFVVETEQQRADPI